MLSRFNTSELFAILDCDEFEELHPKLRKRYKTLLNYKNQLFKIKNTNNLSPSLLSALDDASTPVNVLWGLTSIIGAGFAATVISAISLGLVPVIGGIYCYYTYKSQQDKLSEWTGFFQMAYLKLEAANKIVKRFGSQSNQNLKRQFINSTNHYIEHHIKTASSAITSSIGVTFTSGLTLFGCFYLGMSSMVGSLGFFMLGSLLSGPIGMGIAIGVSLLVATYIGYKHYQSEKNKQAIQGCQKFISNKIRQQSIECHRLKTIADIHQSSNHHRFFNKIKEKTIDNYLIRSKIVQLHDR